MTSFNIKLDDKPHLSKALEENPKLTKEVIGTFVALMEESFDPSKGIAWADIPAQLHRDLTFGDLIRGILRGSLDLKDINPDTFDALKIEVHPLAMLSPRKNYVDGGMRISNWRNHFRLPEDATVSEDTVAKIFRKLLRYSKYIKIEDLAKALEANQLATFRGIGDRNVELLPMMPAIRYQRDKFGDLYAGKLMEDNGFLDCGELPDNAEDCPACKRSPLTPVGNILGCYACNAGYVQKEL